MPKSTYFLLLHFLLGVLQSFGQTQKIDSLKLKVRTTQNSEQKLTALFALCDERHSLNSDSLLVYAAMAQQLSRQQGLALQLVKANYYCYAAMLKISLNGQVISGCDSSLHWLKAQKPLPNQLIALYKALKAQALVRNNNFKEAMTTYYDFLHMAESIDDTLMTIRAKSGIAWVHMEMGQYQESIVWFQKALSTSSNPNLYTQLSNLYSSIASDYNNISQYDSALNFVDTAIVMATKAQNLSFWANALNIRADVYMNTAKNAAAEKDLTTALALRKQVGDPFYIVSDMSQISSFYAITGEYKKGIAMAEQALKMIDTFKLYSKLPILYYALAENYKRSGNYKNYSLIQEKMIAQRDSMYGNNSAQALASLQAQYDVQKKENIIIQQKLDIISKDYWFYGMLILFVFLTIVGLLLYSSYRKKEKAKLMTLLESQRLNEAIAVIKAEEKERKRIAADLHDNLGAYAAAISNNVRNVKEAATFDQALTTRLEQNAQDIVNELNNTIWVLKKETQQITEISDRLKVWLQKLIHNYPGIQFDFEEDISYDITLSPINALQLYHILQECINNALRHSHCSNIVISIVSTTQWLITVADDGVGFDANQVNTGNGIHNLYERAATCGWTIEWKNNVPNGTVVAVGN